MANSKKNVFALLIGIDDYALAPLSGCVNDSKDIEDYLRSHVSSDHLQLMTLRNQQATKRSIVEAFMGHLTQATSDDIVFVHYAGHGSQERAHEMFWHLEPDRMNEVLVAVDSLDSFRGLVNPLADKELKWLIHQVAKKHPHIALMFDCCHSGTATREIATPRFTSAGNSIIRSPEEYVFFQERYGGKAPESYAKSDLRFNVNSGRHILMAGCRSSQTAKELRLGGRQRGAFTHGVLQTLQRSGSKVSYRDLVKGASALVLNKVNDQVPQLEAPIPADGMQYFLDGATSAKKFYTVRYDNKRSNWIMDAGALHGIPAPTAEEETVLGILPESADLEQQHHLSEVEEAKVERVHSHQSIVALSGDNLTLANDQNAAYKAFLLNRPLARTKVLLVAEEPANEEQQKALQWVRWIISVAGPKNTPSLYIEEAQEWGDQADYRIVAYRHEGVNKFRVTKPSDDLPLVKQIEGFSEDAAVKLVAQLQHIARRDTTLQLHNPHTQIDTHDVAVMLLDEDDNELETNDGALILQSKYKAEDDIWYAQFKAKIINNSWRKLYCSLLIINNDYSVSTVLLPGIWLASCEETYAYEGKLISFSIAKELVKLGVTEITDHLKLMVSTEEFDATLLEQKKLQLASKERVPARVPKIGNSTLNLFLQKARCRGDRSFFDLEAWKKASRLNQGRDLVVSDWTTKEFSLIIKRPLASATDELLVDAGVQVHFPKGFYAHINASSLDQESVNKRILFNRRSAQLAAIPNVLLGNLAISQPISLIGRSRGSAPALDVLELTTTAPTSMISDVNPIVLELPLTLDATETIVPIAQKDGLYFPIGYSQTQEQGGTKVIINGLPNAGEEGNTRSLWSTTKIVFQKVVMQRLGLAYAHPYLAIVDKKEDKTLNYCHYNNYVKIANEVESARKILVVVHGFIGESQSLLATHPDQPERHFYHILNKYYDTILAFDYDSYSTSLAQSARDLRERLEQVGLTAGHRKEVHILAHSTGGLIARHFIERLNGSRIVKHLMMTGTPNAGTPMPKVRDWAVLGMSLLLNQLPVVGWPLSVITFLADKLKVVSGLDQVSEDLRPDSDFLKGLQENIDFQTQYTIIAGNTGLIKANGEQTENLVRKLIQQLGIDKASHQALTHFLFGGKNDIIASVQSMSTVNAARHPIPKIEEVACDHFSYYTADAGRTGIENVLAGGK